MSTMLIDGTYDVRTISELTDVELGAVGGGRMSAAQASHLGDAAAGVAGALAMAGLEPLAAAAGGFAIGCYIGAAVMSWS